MSQEIRQATVEDIPALIDMGMQGFQEAPTFAWKTSDYLRQYRVLNLALRNPDAVLLVPEDLSGVLIAHIEVPLWFKEPYAEVDILYVKPEKRNTLRAVNLISAFEDWADSKGIEEIVLSVNAGQRIQQTSKLYARLDYTQIGTIFMKRINHG